MEEEMELPRISGPAAESPGIGDRPPCDRGGDLPRDGLRHQRPAGKQGRNTVRAGPGPSDRSRESGWRGIGTAVGPGWTSSISSGVGCNPQADESLWQRLLHAASGVGPPSPNLYGPVEAAIAWAGEPG